MAGNILDTLRGQIRESLNSYADHVAGGGCLVEGDASATAMKYAHDVGVVEGLARVERHILDLQETLDEQERLDG